MNPSLGLKRILLPVSYWRAVEFGYVWQRLALEPGGRVLDLGSPKELAVMLARELGLEVVATDIQQDPVDVSADYAKGLGCQGDGPGRVRSEVQDGRALPYESGSFGAAYSVSVVEHIPDDGDTRAVGELLRVVQPGGVVVLTVPFSHSYRETFVDHDVYERKQADGRPVFYQRHYDMESLHRRLVEPLGAQVSQCQIWRESYPVETFFEGHALLSHPLAPLEAHLAACSLRRCQEGDEARGKAAFLTLTRRSH